MANAGVTKASANPEGLLKKTIHAGALAAQAGLDGTRLKLKVDHAVEDGMNAARRLAKRGRYAAEDLVDEAAHTVKQKPFRSVAITFGVGLGVGTLVGWLVSRNGRT